MLAAALAGGEPPAPLPERMSLADDGALLVAAPTGKGAKGGTTLHMQGACMWLSARALGTSNSPFELSLRDYRTTRWSDQVKLPGKGTKPDPWSALLGAVHIDDAPAAISGPWSYRYDGVARAYPTTAPVGLAVSVLTFTPRTHAGLPLILRIENTAETPRRVRLAAIATTLDTSGMNTPPTQAVLLRAPAVDVTLRRGEATLLPLLIGHDPDPRAPSAADAATLQRLLTEREALWAHTATHAALRTPDPRINAAHRFQVLRVLQAPVWNGNGRAKDEAPKLYVTTGHNYGPGVWANDCVESPGPLFAYLDDPLLRQAAENTADLYDRLEQRESVAAGRTMACSYEGYGGLSGSGTRRGRGDEAMLLYGMAPFFLAQGERALAERGWSLIDKCLVSIAARMRPDGVLGSQTDEGEGRWPTGALSVHEDMKNKPPKNANVIVNGMALAGLQHAAALARDLGKADVAADCATRAAALRIAIDRVFGAEVEGIATYRHWDGAPTDTLWGWPQATPAFGIFTRAAGCAQGIERMWSAKHGRVVARGPDSRNEFCAWFKVTSYAIRGLFRSGKADQALAHLSSFVDRQVFGHGSAPSIYADQVLLLDAALFTRIATDGMFGLEPTGLRTFTVTPSLPTTWPAMSLVGVRIGGVLVDVDVTRAGDRLHVVVKRQDGGAVLGDDRLAPGTSLAVTVP